MKQLIQKLKSGEMGIQELPMPQIGPGMILVRNHYSLISAGTEGSTVRTARANLIRKAKERPQQVKQVLEVLKKQGPVQTYRAVMTKLNAYSPLGYSSAGEVIKVGTSTNGFSVGDRVACAGVGYANHADVISVPVNLCVKLPDNADLKSACYNTLGAIALQGIRQADMRLGETCVVIGLGLIGQLTCLMLSASGVKVIGVDIDALAVRIAQTHCANLALVRSSPGITDTIFSNSGGIGADSAIITADSNSLDPINFAGEVCRKRGRVIIVGDVPTGFKRDPHYYRKELELRMSCSYGPGRYDVDYEEKGIDYPAPYVRWTENRNMQAFQDLIQCGRIDLDYLTTHEILLDDVTKAYDMIVERSEPFLGIVIKYDYKNKLLPKPFKLKSSAPISKVGVAFIGAGNYAQGKLLPNLPKNDPDIVYRGVFSNTGTTSKRVAERFEFEYCTDDEAEILGNDAVNTIFITTRHDSHDKYVLKALKAGKHVFVEKPLTLRLTELEEIRQFYESSSSDTSPLLMIGFNRRFSPMVVSLKKHLSRIPMSMIFRVNAGAIPAEHWIQDRDIGGGRIIGETCHYIDLMAFLCGSLPVKVFATALQEPQNLNDTVTIQVEFSNGSIGTVAYFSNGSKKLNKEYLEVYQSGLTGVLDDFRQLTIFKSEKTERLKLYSQDKGQSSMLNLFINSVKAGGSSPISFEELYAVTLATFAAERSLVESLPIRLLLDEVLA